jgi:uncharacterized membrane protein YhhN
MTGASWVFLVITAAFAVGDWYAVATERRPLEYLCKPATMVALIAVTASLDPTDPGARRWFLVALVFSLAGDVFLMIPRNLFVAGLASFLLGHVAYIAGLLAQGVDAPALALGAVIVTIAVSTIGLRVVRAVREGDESELAAPVLGYIVVISLMVACAIGTGNPFAIAGSVSFYASDALIAWNRFIEEYPWGHVAIMVTYHVGQVGLVLSLLA